MKILVIGDQHFKVELPYAQAIEDRRRGEWETVKSAIHRAADTCDIVVLLGDNLHAKHNHSAAIDEFITFLKGFGDKPVKCLVGNHERFGTKTALDFLKSVEYPNWTVYTEPTRAPIIEGSSIMGMFAPYLTPQMVGAKDKESGVNLAIEKLKPADIAFFHQGITGAAVHGTMVNLFNEIVFPKEILEMLYGTVFAGHIHQPQRLSDKVQVTGSVFTAEVGEHGKNVYIWNDGVIEEVPLPVRGIYKVELSSETSTATAFNDIPANSIVKVIITDRSVSVDNIRELTSHFDACVIIEQYPSERQKVHFDEGALDLSVENMLRIYADAKKVDYEALVSGYELIK